MQIELVVVIILALYVGIMVLLSLRAKNYTASFRSSITAGKSAAVAFLYATISGFWGAMATASVQSVVILSGILLSCLYLLVGNGPGALLQSLPSDFFDPVPFSGEMLVMLTMPTIISSVISQPVIQRAASSKSERDAVWSHIIAGVLMLPIALLPAVIGMYGRVFFPDTPADAIFSAVASERLPLVLGAFLLAAVICAVVSTCNSVLVSTSTNVVHDVLQEIVCPGISEKGCKRAYWMVNLAISVVGAALALASDDIIRLMSLGYTFISAGCFVPFAMGIVWKRGTVQGAVSSAVVGIAAVLVDFFGIVKLPYASVFPLLPALAAYVLVSFLTKPKNGD